MPPDRSAETTQRRKLRTPEDEKRLTADIIELATTFGRYGYRRITALLRQSGWVVNEKRVERILRREEVKVPSRQPKKGRFWLNDGSCIRLWPEGGTTSGPMPSSSIGLMRGRKFRKLCVIDEFSREPWRSGWSGAGTPWR